MSIFVVLSLIVFIYYLVQSYCFLFTYTHFSAEILHREATFFLLEYLDVSVYATLLIVLPDLSYLDCIVIISTYLRYL